MDDQLNFSVNEDQALPQIAANATFKFACSCDVPCYNHCCAELALPLTPYDLLRLRQNTGLGSQDFLQTFTRMNIMEDTGLPLPFLRMLESPDAPCPFVTPAGCSVYDDRPGACRSYPLGRGSQISRDGIQERFFIIKEDYCRGFDAGPLWTPTQWFKNQGMQTYIYFNDLYMRLMAMIGAAGKPLDKRMTNMCFLCLYQLDKFRQLIDSMRIFERVRLDRDQEKLIMSEYAPGDEACLKFALDWLELIIFGEAKDLQKLK